MICIIFHQSYSLNFLILSHCIYQFICVPISISTELQQLDKSWNFQGCITVYLSRYFVVALRGNSDIISCCFLFVNNFFIFLFIRLFNHFSEKRTYRKNIHLINNRHFLCFPLSMSLCRSDEC